VVAGADEFEGARLKRARKKEAMREHGEKERRHFKSEKAPEWERSSRKVGVVETAVPPSKTVGRVPLNPNRGAPGQSLLTENIISGYLQLTQEYLQ